MKAKKVSSGRKKGAKKWSHAEVSTLLKYVDEVLPAGREQWESVAMECIEYDSTWTRTGESCKNKFEKMAFAKQPTGTADIPMFVLQSKRIKERISRKEVIGFAGGNDSGNDDDDFDSLKATKLFNDDGDMKRPPTKKKKTAQVADAIRDLGADQVLAADKLQSAITSIANAFGNSNTNNNEESVSETRLERLEEDVTSMKDTLGDILKLLKKEKE